MQIRGFKYFFGWVAVIGIQTMGICQEQISPASENPILQKTVKASPHKSQNTQLPFFDDFSHNSTFPDIANWMNGDVFINTAYGKNPPSIGVATFDAINQTGFIHEGLSEITKISDSLTSRVIDLSGSDMNSTFLSFYYQPQGFGNEPEQDDSLLLQFITPDTTATVWFANGCSFDNFISDTLKISDSNTDTLMFKLVLLKVGNAFQDSHFQFRFVNYASISQDNDEFSSRRTNCDHWNIDYVYLNENRTEMDTIFRDMAMVAPPGSFIKTYSSVPWAHFTPAVNKLLRDSEFHIRNNDSIARNMKEIKLYMTEEISQTEFNPKKGEEAIGSFTNTSFKIHYSEPPFEWQEQEKAIFSLTAELFVDGADRVQNNTAYRKIVCDNYYAYDDGTAEYAYNIYGDARKVAYRYTTYQSDSLGGFSMYFLRNKEQESALETFIACVWSSENGSPGTLLYKKETADNVAFEDSLNQFITIWLDSAIYVEDEFFIGWEQEQNKSINLGFDANIDSHDKRFYFNNSLWIESDDALKGSLMLRPIFAKAPTEEEKSTSLKSFVIFPNPSSGSFALKNNQEVWQGEIYIYNQIGILVAKETLKSEAYDFSNLKNGLYFIRIESDTEPTEIIKWLKQ